MEDILASIRRILNEDEAAVASPVNLPVTSAPAEEPAAEMLNLTEAMLVAEPEPAAPPPYTPPPEPEPPPPPPPPPVFVAPPMPEPRADPAPVSADEALLGAAATAAAAASVGSLFRAVAADRGAAVYRGGPSIEDVVREELRPLLKQWLDSNLPPVVERLVRAEIERVVARALT
jgi:cell pole-organizing protein PopZ